MWIGDETNREWKWQGWFDYIPKRVFERVGAEYENWVDKKIRLWDVSDKIICIKSKESAHIKRSQ